MYIFPILSRSPSAESPRRSVLIKSDDRLRRSWEARRGRLSVGSRRRPPRAAAEREQREESAPSASLPATPHLPLKRELSWDRTQDPLSFMGKRNFT